MKPNCLFFPFMNMIRRGKLCRKCLNLVDATPATLIGTAFHLMGETAVEEVSNSKFELLSTNLPLSTILFFFYLVVKKTKDKQPFPGF